MRTIHRKSTLALASATLMAGLLSAGATFAAEMKVKLSGDQEVPPVQTQASGNGTITVNDECLSAECHHHRRQGDGGAYS